MLLRCLILSLVSVEFIICDKGTNATTEDSVQSRSGNIPPKLVDRTLVNKRIDELIQEVAKMITEDITEAGKSLARMGTGLSDEQAKEFFQNVALATLDRIESNLIALKSLVVDTEAVSQTIADKIANMASHAGVKLLSKSNALEERIYGGGVVGISQIAKEFIKMALNN